MVPTKTLGLVRILFIPWASVGCLQKGEVKVLEFSQGEKGKVREYVIFFHQVMEGTYDVG